MKEYKPLISGKNSSNYQMATRKTELIKAMRHFDHTVNYWVMQHLNVAIKYIEHSGKVLGEATGGSD
jgi:tryptophan 2,3-dioxygenase